MERREAVLLLLAGSCLLGLAGPVTEWRCDAAEDTALFSARQPHKIQSMGFLMFAVGEKALRESEFSVSCLRTTFGPEVNVTVVANTNLTCEWHQRGDDGARACWALLMREKLAAARSTPYDLTVMIDTDVFANPGLPARASVLSHLKGLFRRYDIGGTYGPLPDPPGVRDGYLNGGWIAYYKSDITDRFFACADRMMQTSPGLHEQGAYENLLKYSDYMSSVTAKVLPGEWQCRGTLGAPVWIENEKRLPCVFVHWHLDEDHAVPGTCLPILRDVNGEPTPLWKRGRIEAARAATLSARTKASAT